MLPIMQKNETYSSQTGEYNFSSYRYDVQDFDSSTLSQNTNELNFFNQSQNSVGILRTNMENPNQLPEATSFRCDQIEVRCSLEIHPESSITELSGDLARQFRDWVSKCVARFGYDQIANYGTYPLVKHFPVDGVAAEVTYQSGGAVAAGSIYQGNQNISSTIVLPVPLQIGTRITFNPKLFAPKWIDEDTQIRISYLLGGEECKSARM
jgi:hypothetical protein